jgi:hypothetical protein
LWPRQRAQLTVSPSKNSACRADDVAQFVSALICGEDGILCFSTWSIGPPTKNPVAASDSFFIIAGDLLTDKTVVGEIGIKSADDVVAIGPMRIFADWFISKPWLSAKRATSSQCRAQRSPKRGEERKSLHQFFISCW